MKNIYYLFGVNDHLFKDISLHLNKEGGGFSFYGLAYAKTSNLEDAIFNNVTYISDLLKERPEIDYLFLKELEIKYDLTISDLIQVDRHLMRFPTENRLAIAQTLLLTFLNEIKCHGISIIFSASVADFISLFASIYCKKNNIKFRYFIASGLGEYFYFSDSLTMEPIGFKKSYDDTLKKFKSLSDKAELRKLRIEFFEKKPQAGYVTKAGFLYKFFELQDFFSLLSACKSYLKDTSGFHYKTKPWALPFQRLTRILRKSQYIRYIRSKKLSFTEIKELDYLVFPLQVYPEASTIVQGRRFHDQLGIIEMLSKALPVNVMLIVKEHRVFIGKRPAHFYKSIANLHNVKFVAETIDSYDLIKYSKGIATISSTMGLEALLVNKPVLVFGERFYQFFPNTFIATDFRGLKSQVDKVLAHQFDNEAADAIFESLIRVSYNIGFFLPNVYSSEQLQKLTAIILTNINS